MRVDRLPPQRRDIRLRDVIAKLPADEAATFYFIAACTEGRPRFTSTLSDLVKKTNCSRDRFVRLAAQLVSRGLVTMHGTIHLGSELVIWGVPQYPSDWERPVLGEKRFKIPIQSSGGGRPRRKAP